jgi:predicted DNA-binding transcriptional regulator YafY
MLRKVDSKGRTRSEMADHLGVSVRTITRMVARGELIREEGAGRENLYYEVFDEFSHARQVAGHETGQSRLASSANIQAGETAYETGQSCLTFRGPFFHKTCRG